MDKSNGATASAYSLGLMTAIFGGITVQELALWIGILCTVGTFAVNSYYRWKEDKREEQRLSREQNRADVGSTVGGVVPGKRAATVGQRTEGTEEA